MIARIFSAAVWGIEAWPVIIESNCEHGLPAIVIVGLPDASVKESRDRVKSAIKNSGFKMPYGHTVVNLAPADVKKEGPGFDLPIALAILAASQQIKEDLLKEFWIVGELSLDGEVRPIKGALAIALAALKGKCRGLLVPADNAKEAATIKGLDVFPVRNLREAIDFLEKKIDLNPEKSETDDLFSHEHDDELDFADVKGQEHVKRAIEIAVAGGHNLLMIGPPGSGKSMLAKRIPSIFPPFILEEALETTLIHSAAGLLSIKSPIVLQRPFRSPHHSISDAGLIGGTSNPSPGEVSLSHHGVLFLDELPEFNRNALEALRQPLEEGKVTISRAAGSMTFPAQLMLVAAMNPSPSGAKTTAAEISESQRYLNRLSRPLLDRIDLHIEVPAIDHETMVKAPAGESSLEIRKRVMSARERQQKRFSGRPNINCNAQMSVSDLKKFVVLNEDCQNLLTIALSELNLSARAYDRILKVARTIADLADRDSITVSDIGEAVLYRCLDRQFKE